MEFIDRILKCSDCSNDFIFTAGEQLFFADRQFKNDPKRCKLCKAKRAGVGRSTASGASAATSLPLSRTETRTECSACGIETTVPFKPTQGRPVLCRSCFQMKRVPSSVAAAANLDSVSGQIAAATAALQAIGTEQARPSSGSTVTMIEQTPAELLADAGSPAAAELTAVAAGSFDS